MLAAASMTPRPVAVEPVKWTMSTSVLSASTRPVSEPSPVTTLTTPSGMPASAAMRPISSAVLEVNSEGLTTTVQPAASAKGSFWARIRVGKFHGMMSPATPTGSRTTVAV